MKAFLAVLVLMISTSAFAAEKMILACSTPGDALEDVHLIEDEKGAASLKILYPSEEVVTLKMTATLKNIKGGYADTLVAAVDVNDAFGGAIHNAALIRVLPGQKKAFLAYAGSVFYLNCRK